MENSKKYKCICCGYYTLEEEPPNSYEICPVCFWEQDNVQNSDPTFEGGANDMCLLDAREMYKKIGAIDSEYLKYVRGPLEEEKY